MQSDPQATVDRVVIVVFFALMGAGIVFLIAHLL